MMKRVYIITILFGFIIPVLHVVHDYPWRGWFLVTTVICTVLIGALGYITAYTWYGYKVGKKEQDAPPVDINPHALELWGKVVKSGTTQIICPVCPYGVGESDHILNDGNLANKELFVQTCKKCGSVYTSVRMTT